MNKLIIPLLGVGLFLSPAALYSYEATKNPSGLEYFSPYEGPTYPTDEELKALAVEKSILPAEVDSVYFKKEITAKNTVTVWLMMDRKAKLDLIEQLKTMFKEQGKTIIRKPAGYYVDEINGVLYNCIMNGDIVRYNNRGIGNIFKTIAVMDGDFDNGKDKIELFKELLSDKALAEFKKQCPERYNELVEKREIWLNKFKKSNH